MTINEFLEWPIFKLIVALVCLFAGLATIYVSFKPKKDPPNNSQTIVGDNNQQAGGNITNKKDKS